MNFTCFLYGVLGLFLFQSDYNNIRFFSENVNAKHVKYEGANALDVSNIPTKLLENAHAVVRFESVNCNIKSHKKLEIVVEKAVTILSEKGISAGNVSIYYNNKSDEIKNLKIEILDRNGNSITKIKEKEINDVSQFDGFSIANDARRKVYRHVSNSYPYTILVSYKKQSKNTLIIPSWYPVPQTNVSVEESTFKINTSVSDLSIANKQYNIDAFGITIDEQLDVFTASQINAIPSEENTPSFYSFLPFVRFSPSSFHYFGFDGSYLDWESYGKWMYDNMLTGRGELPPELIDELEEKLSGKQTDIEKAKIIYDHVTNSTRYVSVQLGIGGFMPFTCSDVYTLKYGDCKALSYYTQNLMQYFGIEAIYTEIKSDRQYNYNYDIDLPGVDQGNHIILCLPNQGDTIWLECTSKNLPFGYTHSGINDRKALLIKPSGGEIVHTKAYTATENVSIRDIKMRLDGDSQLTIEFSNEHRNLKNENMLHLLDIDQSKRDKYIKEYYYDQLASLDILSYNTEMDREKIIVYENGKFSTNNHVEKAGNYRMIPINVFTYNLPEKLKTNRSFPIYSKDSKSDSIFISMKVPDGMMYVPSEKSNIIFENEFGEMSSKTNYEQNENELKVKIYFQLNGGTFLPSSVEHYNEYVENLDKIIHQKLIIKPIQ